MSTRAHVIIRKSGQEDQFVYHHCDGYPEGVGSELDDVFRNSNYSDTYTAAKALEEYDYQYRYEDYGIHGDEEYLYLVDLDAKTITCYEVLKCGYVDASLDIMNSDHVEYVHLMSSGKTAEDTENYGDELRNKLREGIVSFKYRKVNGDERTAVGTLKIDVLEKYDAVPKGASTNEHPDYIRYFDMNSEGWRSFRVDHLIQID